MSSYRKHRSAPKKKEEETSNPEATYAIDLTVTRTSTGEKYAYHQDVPATGDFYKDELPAIQHALIEAVADFYENGDTFIPSRPGSSFDDGFRATPSSREEVEALLHPAIVKENERIHKLILEERAKHTPVAPVTVPEQNIKNALHYLTALLADDTRAFNFERMKTRLAEILSPVPDIPNTRPMPTPQEAMAHAKKIKAQAEADIETSPYTPVNT